ncbi:hypothetical protein [Actinoplanes friuliensis]|uniref:hypothetical protein n=1 Tax=Actinoplanes friuliensis TaxID=196914 RepID=UPI0005A2C873|nr:hypothetical protein [Actinoplanes friuliensis]
MTPSPSRYKPGVGTHVVVGLSVAALMLWGVIALIWGPGLIGVSIANCGDTTTAICTPAGKVFGPWSAPVGAGLGLAAIIYGCWIRVREHPALWLTAGLFLTIVGFLITQSLASGAPGV